MKKLMIASLAIIVLLASCGGGGNQPAGENKASTTTQANPADPMQNKGIGPVKELKLDAQVDTQLAAQGKEIYVKYCTACHKETEKFIGPAPKGILSRRSPEWVMNMILNPVEMTQKDPIAKKLLMEANGAPMANQNMTQEQARAILEYFRTL